MRTTAGFIISLLAIICNYLIGTRGESALSLVVLLLTMCLFLVAMVFVNEAPRR